MTYEKFRQEIERILTEQCRPVTWNEIRANSTKLNQKAPYHVYVQKLQGDIGLVRFKHNQRTVWALRDWFEAGKFRELLPEKLRLTILALQAGYALAANEYGELKRVYPLDAGLRTWDVIEAGIADYFPEADRRPDSIELEPDETDCVRTVDSWEDRIRIAEKVAESGEFLHTDAWRGKTLGVTKPRFRCFYFYDAHCQFFCDQNVCLGHDVEVTDGGAGLEITGDKVYFVLEAAERARGEFIWQKKQVEWFITAEISLTDPRQRRLL
ncbi:MAG TPA: hypothetical protein ENN68_07285 [Methanomicrobia archaeon]|nr:hypothetical protein [Methanomicrobia archaeon]